MRKDGASTDLAESSIAFRKARCDVRSQNRVRPTKSGTPPVDIEHQCRTQGSSASTRGPVPEVSRPGARLPPDVRAPSPSAPGRRRRRPSCRDGACCAWSARRLRWAQANPGPEETSVNKSELVARLTERLGGDRTIATAAVNGVLEEIESSVARGRAGVPDRVRHLRPARACGADGPQPADRRRHPAGRVGGPGVPARRRVPLAWSPRTGAPTAVPVGGAGRREGRRAEEEVRQEGGRGGGRVRRTPSRPTRARAARRRRRRRPARTRRRRPRRAAEPPGSGLPGLTGRRSSSSSSTSAAEPTISGSGTPTAAGSLSA